MLHSRFSPSGVEIEIPAGIRKLVEKWTEPNPTFYHGTGCEQCRNTGYHGRTGLFELMVLDQSIRDKIMVRSASGDIAKVAKASGMKLLREDGWEKVLAGVTTPEEVTRSTRA